MDFFVARHANRDFSGSAVVVVVVGVVGVTACWL
jgi:hypothetical protein